MGRGLAGHGQALRFRFADESDALFRGNVADMVIAAGLPHEVQVALHLAPLALGGNARQPVLPGVAAGVDDAAAHQRIDLAVRRDDLPEGFRLPHRGFHHLRALHAHAVVGKRDHPRRKLLHGGERGLFFADGDAAVGMHAHERVPPHGFQLRLEIGGAVRHRPQVRHGADVREAAVRRRRRSRADRLFIRKSRFPQMNVNI